VTRPDDDTAWREIVANYGERVLQPEEPASVTEGSDPPEPQAEEPERHHELAESPDLEERFVPPPPPPLPRLPKDRLAAWLGVLVSPVLLLITAVFRVPLPSFAAWLLVGAFLGGFGYLVAQMPRGPRDPFDDGAVL
jgi:hypothetical protein